MTPIRAIFPRLAHKELVKIGNSKYWANWWSDRTYEFELVSDRLDKADFTFTRSEAEVSQAIIDGKIERK